MKSTSVEVKGINERKYAEIIVRLSTLLRFATEIKEMDINPLLADDNDVIAVDARILIENNEPTEDGGCFRGTRCEVREYPCC